MVSLSHTKHRLVTRKGSGAGSEEARQVPSPEYPFWPKGWGASAGSGGPEAPPPLSPEHHLLCRGSESGSQVDLRAPHSTQLKFPSVFHRLAIHSRFGLAVRLGPGSVRPYSDHHLHFKFICAQV